MLAAYCYQPLRLHSSSSQLYTCHSYIETLETGKLAAEWAQTLHLPRLIYKTPLTVEFGTKRDQRDRVLALMAARGAGSSGRGRSTSGPR